VRAYLSIAGRRECVVVVKITKGRHTTTCRKYLLAKQTANNLLFYWTVHLLSGVELLGEES
jgi:hypothetical protein